jgi:hypothetical protein
MRITKGQLRRIIREEAKGVTKKYDEDSALQGDQDELPDALQKGIIDKTVDDREEEEEKKKNESSFRVSRRQLRRIIREELMLETAPTFGLRNGDSVRHKDEPERGLGKVVAKGSSRDRVVLVKWENGRTQRHDPSSLKKERR